MIAVAWLLVGDHDCPATEDMCDTTRLKNILNCCSSRGTYFVLTMRLQREERRWCLTLNALYLLVTWRTT